MLTENRSFTVAAFCGTGRLHCREQLHKSQVKTTINVHLYLSESDITSIGFISL